MRNKVEILAPAGGEEALRAAVLSGADAVYLGGRAFGARANAQNFSEDELRRAVEFCHERDVAVHLTVNTLLRDTELSDALEFVKFLCSLPVDAVLIQDMGLFSLLRERAPELNLHASTQMSLHTPSGARLLHELGASRVVLARELSLKEIEEISKACPVELESFVHGALCMSVSGQCYFSAMLGGRSGNRGMCAQPCRLPFAAAGGTGHDLSLKDLSFINNIEKLKAAGISSAKIEGRMKRPEYVAAAVTACRRAADGEPVPRELTQNLEAVFSRSGFTQGYLEGKHGRNMFGVRTKEDVTSATEKLFSSLRELYRSEKQKLAVKMELLEKDGFAVLTVRDGGSETVITEELMDIAPLSHDRCLQQLKKTGGTPFFAESVSAPENGIKISVSVLNSMRREGLQKLLEMRSKRKGIAFSDISLSLPKREQNPRGRLPIRASFHSAEQLCEAAKACESIMLPLGTDMEKLLEIRNNGFENMILELPRAMFGAEREIKARMEKALSAGFKDFSCGNLGAVALARELGANIHGSYSLNITNTASLEFFKKLGLSSAELSFELSGREINAVGGKLPRGVMLYGRQALMLVRNCPIANSERGCLNCKEPNCLTDRMKVKFPVICNKDGLKTGAEVLNSVPLWLGDRESELKGADFGVFRFTVENPVECAEVLDTFFRQETPDFSYTRGLFQKGVK